MSASIPSQSSPFEALPRNVSTSLILPYVTSDDWLKFRLASRGCYEIVHGHGVSRSFCAICRSDDTGNGNGNGNGTSASSSRQTRSSRNAIIGDSEGEESESLWRLALVREYQFDDDDDDDLSGDETLFHQSFRPPSEPQSDAAFLSTDDMFTASNSFISWKHWRKIDLRFHTERLNNARRRGEGVTVGDIGIPQSEGIVGPYFLRACSMWRKIEQWCDDESRSGTFGGEIKASFAPGKALDPGVNCRIQNVQTSALKAVYAFYAGQRDPPMMTDPDSYPDFFNPFFGLFGGFQAYDAISCTRLLEPRHTGQSQFTVAQSMGLEKVIIMELATGQLFSIFFGGNGQHHTLVATTSVGGTTRTGRGNVKEDIVDPLDGKDSILRWFEEHGDRLDRDIYSVGNMVFHPPGEDVQSFSALMRYPTVADTVNCSRAVTRGVEVVASAIFAPEMSTFVYSIRMRLLTPEDGEEYMSPEQRGFNTCQLLSRHWRITTFYPNSEETKVEEVRGEGVIGSYPLLYEGGYGNYEEVRGGRKQLTEQSSGSFSYQSCTAAVPGFIEGNVQFRPGSLKEPSGELFDVRVAPFPLKASQFLY